MKQIQNINEDKSLQVKDNNYQTSISSVWIFHLLIQPNKSTSSFCIHFIAAEGQKHTSIVYISIELIPEICVNLRN